MNAEKVFSSVLLLAVMWCAVAVVRMIAKRLHTSKPRYSAVVLLWAAALLSIWYIDVNIPLSASHYRPGDEAAPMWMALLAEFLQFAAISVSLIVSKPHAASSGKPSDNPRQEKNT